LEHIRKKEFVDTIIETKRILKPNGICSHEIDLRDHLNESLNNLRFSENFGNLISLLNQDFTQIGYNLNK